MHATFGYPVKSTWLKVIKAGNFSGWPIINKRRVSKYDPETTETPKGRLNQTRKDGRLIITKTRERYKVEAIGRTTIAADATSQMGSKQSTCGTSVSAANFVFEEPNTLQLKGKEVRDIYTKVYDVRESLLWSNWLIPHKISTRKQLSHGQG